MLGGRGLGGQRLWRQSLRPLATAPPPTSGESPAAEIERCYAQLDKSFCNTKEAYRSKTNWELARGLFVLRLCAVKPLVQHNQKVIKLSQRLLGKRLFEEMMKKTFYGHFVAGADEDEIAPVIRKMKEYGVKAILDYSVEADLSKEEAKEKTKASVGAEKGAASGEAAATPAPAAPAEAEEDAADPFQPIKRYKANVEEFSDRRDGAVVRTYFYSGEPECDRNMEIFLKSIDGTATATEGTGFVAVKLTALGRPQLLLQLSEVIAQTQKFYQMLTGSPWEAIAEAKLTKERLLRKMKEFGVKADSSVVEIEAFFDQIDEDGDGFVDIHEWGQLIDRKFKLGDAFRVYNLRKGRMEPLIKPMSREDAVQFEAMLRRIETIAEAARERGIRMMVDAEQTYFQPAISRLAMDMMRKYNKEGGVVFNTYQAYLRATHDAMQLDMHLARREGFHFGAKLVRGAYLEQERKRATSLGYPDPVNPTYDATTEMYHRCLKAILNEYASRGPGSVSVLAATHNEDSVRFAVEEMRSRDIAPSEKILCFGQLYGMCDQVSFSLGQAGFSVYKYVPYGPISDVLPYLSRRALENNAIFEKAMKERQLMWTELKRRWQTGEKGGLEGPFAHVPAPTS